MTKQLTIAVPSYNMEKLLPACLDSLADERFRGALEVLVVDDGSTDGTAALAQAYVGKMPDLFRVIRKENGGHGSAVNAALAEATGRYFRIVDADDWVNTENLVSLIDGLAQTEADVVLDEKTEADMRTGEERYFAFPEGMPDGKDVPFEAIALPEYRYHLSLHTMSVRRELLLEHKIALLERTFYVDSQYVLEATAFARSARVFRLGIYCYRVGNENQSVHYLNCVKRYQEHDRVLDECLRFLSRREFSPDREAFVVHSAALLARTQLKIALIYNPDRRAGRRQARALRKKLKEGWPAVLRGVERRYREGMILSLLGVRYEELESIIALGKRLKRR